jgi:metal-responsive CopG/Arc/MetJ family transcriptional regulator
MDMPGSKAKTSFTLDQDLFTRAEDLSRKLHISRSEFYARAIDDFVRTLEERELKERINAAQLSLSDDARAEGQAVTEFLRRATARTVGRDAW